MFDIILQDILKALYQCFVSVLCGSLLIMCTCILLLFAELYEICACRAEDRIKQTCDSDTASVSDCKSHDASVCDIKTTD